MLTLTTDAADAIERILESPGMPDGAGIRIASVELPMDSASALSTNSDSPPSRALELTVAEEPELGDEVIDQAGARVFVEDAVTQLLDDKLLDAELVEDRLQFSLEEQS